MPAARLGGIQLREEEAGEGELAGVSRWRDEHRGVVMRDGKVQAGGLADKGQKRQSN